MDITHPKLLSLLHQVKQVKHEHELTARITGENFNVFGILGLSTAEVRTHSAFLAELLNSKGSHGQGSAYLKLFLQRLDMTPDVFTADGSSARVEHYIGPVDLVNGLGGQIDILLTDEPHKRHIVIENKIYAGDQEQQLVRYSRFDKTATLLYLTLYGHKPDPKAIKGLSDNCFKSVSYKEHILGWLNDCHKASISLPIIRETIAQYIFLIRKLTGQTKETKVIEQAKKLILDNPDLIDSVVVLGEAWQSIRNEVREHFANEVKSGSGNKDFILGDRGVLRRGTPSDCGGFVIAFRLELQNGQDMPVNEAQRFYETLLGVKPTAKRSKYWNVGWYTPKGFSSGEFVDTLLSKQHILGLYCKEQEMKDLVTSVLAEAECITQQLQVAFVNADNTLPSKRALAKESG